MPVTVTGARGKVGVVVVRRLLDAGHDVLATDCLPAGFDSDEDYVQADLVLPGDAYEVVRRADAVVHLAAIPAPGRHPDHVVLANNVLAAYHVFHGAAAANTKRIVHLSSETVYGFGFSRHATVPVRLPVDEAHPCTPSDPYGLSKQLCESIIDAVTRPSGLDAVSLRAAWVYGSDEYAAMTSPEYVHARRNTGLWSYIDVCDLADAVCLALESDTTGHVRLNVAAPENIVGEPLRDLAHARFGPDVPVEVGGREDRAGLDSTLAEQVLGFQARRAWPEETQQPAAAALDEPRRR